MIIGQTLDSSATSLPIEAMLPTLAARYLRDPRLVICAEPGAGKSTVLPLWILQRLAPSRRLILVQPRRLAATALAEFLAGQLGETLGQQVGLRTRNDTRDSAQSRLLVVTSGVFLRMVQADPALDGVDFVLFDEFHERSWQQDLALAFSLEAQLAYRDEVQPLRLWLMSATPPTDTLTQYLDAPMLTASGRCYPVALRYQPLRNQALAEGVAATVRSSLAEGYRHLLVFLPGWREIQACLRLLESVPAEVLPLHARLPRGAQRLALEAAGEQPRVVLSTNVAQTSITIDGVDCVIDSGLARSAQFEPALGRDQLKLGPISRASADQRTGRAGRTREGLCIRLWDKEQQGRRVAEDAPELGEADLAPALLELAGWGVLQAPPAMLGLNVSDGRFLQATEVLQALGAVTAQGVITGLGQRMLRLGLAPRLAAMVCCAEDVGSACWLAAALADDSDPQRHSDDVTDWLSQRCREPHIQRQAQQLWRRLGHPGRPDLSPECVPSLLLWAYPERLARQRPDQANSYLCRGGEAFELATSSSLLGQTWLAVAQLRGRRIALAGPINEDTVLHSCGHLRESKRRVALAEDQNTIIGREQVCLGAIVLEERRFRPSPDQALPVLMAAVRERGWRSFDRDQVLNQILARGRWLQGCGIDLGLPDDATLDASLDHWLAPYCAGIWRVDELAKLDWHAVAQHVLSRDVVRELDAQAPKTWRAPSGRDVLIDYSNSGGAQVEVRIAECFGLDQQPLLGEVQPLRIVLLNPAGRPIQITADLPGFWRNAWQQVRKELRGRYPKHDWPEQPWLAAPRLGTGRARR